MISPNWYPPKKYLRQFAAICLPAFCGIGYLVSRRFDAATTGWALAAFGGVCFLVGMIRPDAIRLVYVSIIAVTLPIGWIVSQVLLRVIYYVILTPLGLLFRVVGRDPLQLRRPNVESYWVEHAPVADVKSYYRQT